MILWFSSTKWITVVYLTNAKNLLGLKVTEQQLEEVAQMSDVIDNEPIVIRCQWIHWCTLLLEAQ